MNRKAIVAVISLLCGCGSTEQGYFGAFSGPLDARFLEDDDGRKVEVLADFSFTDPNGMVWTAKKGDTVDGASIPRQFWSVIGSPLVGKYRKASVIHDVYCAEEPKTRTWESVHLAFFYAMRASGVSPTKAKTMYAAVYYFGPDWPFVTTTQRVLVREASERKIVVPAEYTTVDETILAEAEKTVWKRQNEVQERDEIIRRERDNEGQERLLVKIPARYETVATRVMTMPASARIEVIPAIFESTSEISRLPRKQPLTEKQFEELESMIVVAEAGDSPISLADIANFAGKNGDSISDH